MLDPKYEQRPNEDWREYGLRLIGILIEEHPIDLEWQDIVDALGLNIHRDSLRKAQNTEFGGYPIYKYMLEKIDKLQAEKNQAEKNQKDSTSDSDEYLKEIKQARRELENEKCKIRDERNELKRLQREEARRESFVDLVRRIMEESISPIPFSNNSNFISECSDNDCLDVDTSIVIPVTDVHCGLHCDNMWNNYSVEELTCRLNTYFKALAKIQKLHRAKECVVVLGGDLISGAIHKNLRLENNENVVEQIKLVSICLTNFIRDLSDMFDKIRVYSVSGNHSRVMPNKEEALKGEELDALVPFYIKNALQNYSNVYVSIENSVDDTMVAFTVAGHLWYAVHGTYDNPSSVVQQLTMITGIKPEAILMGHKHTNAMMSVYDTKVIQSGCMSGADNYSIEKRLLGSPEQFVVITNSEQVVECLYDIQLSDAVKKATETIIDKL